MYQDLVQEIKERFGKPNIAKKLDSAAMARIRKLYASDLSDDEEPLLAGQGYEILVTDKNIRGTVIDTPIPLESIFIVSKARFDLIECLTTQGTPRTKLLVNGREFIDAATGVMPVKFLIAVLEALGQRRRKDIADQGGRPQIEDTERCMIAAAAVCAKRPTREAVDILDQAGVDSSQATEIIDFMAEIHSRKNRLGGLMLLMAGFAVTGIPFMLIWLMKSLGFGFGLVLKGVGVLGIVIALAGLYKTITGNNGVDEAVLVNRWLMPRK